MQKCSKTCNNVNKNMHKMCTNIYKIELWVLNLKKEKKIIFESLKYTYNINLTRDVSSTLYRYPEFFKNVFRMTKLQYLRC